MSGVHLLIQFMLTDNNNYDMLFTAMLKMEFNSKYKRYNRNGKIVFHSFISTVPSSEIVEVNTQHTSAYCFHNIVENLVHGLIPA